jgi:uncharacterized membrane protein
LVAAELRGRSLGHPLHPALTDLPIGFWTSAMLLDLTGGRETSHTANTLVGWGLVSAVPTIVTGLADIPRLTTRAQRVVVVHAAANIAATVGYLGSWLIRRDPRRHTLGMVVGLAAGTAATVGGYLGGWLAQSPDASDRDDSDRDDSQRDKST